MKKQTTTMTRILPRSFHRRFAIRKFSSVPNNRVVVLGGGWGGFQLPLYMDKKVPLTVISPRNHFLFTPLLPSTIVGTLEHRCIQEPIRRFLGSKDQYIQAKARKLDTVNKKVICESLSQDTFEVEYDKLVIAVGVKTNTFGIESVQKKAEEGDDVFFLKQLKHSRTIRDNIIDAFEKAALPSITEAERKRLLSFVFVGGGPTTCEAICEVHDFLRDDVKALYPQLSACVSLTLVEAGPALLGPFDRVLQDYVLRLFKGRDIDVRLGTAVVGVEDFSDEKNKFDAKRALLSDGTTLDFGTMVWSAGLAPRKFTADLDEATVPRHERSQRILIDEFLRVKGHEGSIWAIGDAAANESGPPLPQLAQVARQQGIYLANVFSGKIGEAEKPFSFFSLGSMAFMGDLKGIYDGTSAGPLRESDKSKSKSDSPAVLTGFAALVMWRFAYWGRQVSVTNKLLIPVHWMKTFFFGRDVSRF